MQSRIEITLTQEHWQLMRDHVADEDPFEACGLIGGDAFTSTRVYPLANILKSQFRFQIEPQSQLQVFRTLEESDWDLLAIYHSHPAGPPYPSATDIAEAAYPDAFNLIWAKIGAHWQCNAFIITNDSFQKAKINITSIS